MVAEIQRLQQESLIEPYVALCMVAEIQSLQQEGVTKPTNYAALAVPILVVKKANGKIRRHVDYSTGFNDSLDAPQHQLPVPKDLFTKLYGEFFLQKLFFPMLFFKSKSIKSSFPSTPTWFCLDSTVLAPGYIFQQTMTRLTIVVAFIDGIVVAAASQDFFREQIEYFNSIFNIYSRKPDLKNTLEIKNMPTPTNVVTLRSFLGLVSYYSDFFSRTSSSSCTPEQSLNYFCILLVWYMLVSFYKGNVLTLFQSFANKCF